MTYDINPWRFAAMWLWFCLPVIHAGCSGSRLDVPPPGTYSPLVAVSLGVAASDTDPAPTPSPTPAPAGKCENCNGTGKLGDGTVSVPCPVCGGDGRTDNELPDHIADPGKKVAPLDPLAVPVPGDKRVVPPNDPSRWLQPPPKLPPPTEAQKATIRQSQPVYESAPRRGLFRRWRGGSVSSGASAGSC